MSIPTEVHALIFYTRRPCSNVLILCIFSLLSNPSIAATDPTKSNKEVSSFSTYSGQNSQDGTIDVNATAIYRNFGNNNVFQDTLMGLVETRYLQNDFMVDLGVIYQNQDDKGVSLNQFYVSDYHKKFDYKVGKFVTKMGVLDYASSINSFNRQRTDYYDEPNINLRAVSSNKCNLIMLQVNQLAAP